MAGVNELHSGVYNLKSDSWEVEPAYFNAYLINGSEFLTSNVKFDPKSPFKLSNEYCLAANVSRALGVYMQAEVISWMSTR